MVVLTMAYRTKRAYCVQVPLDGMKMLDISASAKGVGVTVYAGNAHGRKLLGHAYRKRVNRKRKGQRRKA